jgi:hypothetical protein
MIQDTFIQKFLTATLIAMAATLITTAFVLYV